MTRLRQIITLPLAIAVAALGLAIVPVATAQLAAPALVPGALAARITAPIDGSARALLAHSRPPMADPAHDLGPVSPSLALHGMSIIFSRTPAQSATLAALIAAQQDPASAQYHQWLTPAQFAAQFGVADADIAATSAWLQRQGFTIDSIGPSRSRITFSGTAAQADAAFGTALHNFAAPDGTSHFAPSADLTVPAALGSSVLAIENVSSFRLHPSLRLTPHVAIAQSAAQAVTQNTNAVKPLFTSAQTGSHFLAPGDVAVMYDIKPAYSAGYTGAGQAIVIAGQSAVLLSDIAAFQSAAGVTAKAPIPVLVPSSGAAYISPGDEGESDLDLEYSSTMAPGAQVYFVYTGDNSNLGVFQSIEYAIETDMAPIISVSYGGCEAGFGQALISALDSFLQQGNAQGQTILASSGDSGSTSCYGDYAAGNVNNDQLAVSYPASSPYVTAMGGTEIPVSASAASNSTYFTAASGTDVLTSLKSYVPEQVWNDDIVEGAPASGGGGTSTFEGRPSYQAGTFGGVAFPAGATRLLPDISLVASNYSAPLLFCTSDSSDWNTVANHGTAPYQVASCNSGFRDATSQDLTAAGGTSFDAPIFAGLLAVINQARQPNGQGNVNPTLYALAGNPTTYASAFHDTVTGGNQCLAVSVCGVGAQTSSYTAVTGYDQASGLGSIDFYNLLTAWPATAASTLLATSTTVSASAATPNLGATETITITVAQNTPGVAATAISGSVNITVDASPATTLTLVGGSVTYSYTPTTGGYHVILATYTGDTTHAVSHGSATITVNEVTLSATSVTVASGNSVVSTLTLTPIGTFTGKIDLDLASYTGNLTNFCINGNGSLTITAAGVAATEPLTLYTNATTCNQLGLSTFSKRATGSLKLGHAAALPVPARPGKSNGWPKSTSAAALACMLLSFGLRRRKLARTGLFLGFAMLLSVAGGGLTGCSNGAAGVTASTTSPTTGATATDTIPGSYTLTIGGLDDNTGQAVASATFTVTVQ